MPDQFTKSYWALRADSKPLTAYCLKQANKLKTPIRVKVKRRSSNYVRMLVILFFAECAGIGVSAAYFGWGWVAALALMSIICAIASASLAFFSGSDSSR